MNLNKIEYNLKGKLKIQSNVRPKLARCNFMYMPKYKNPV